MEAEVALKAMLVVEPQQVVQVGVAQPKLLQLQENQEHLILVVVEPGEVGVIIMQMEATAALVWLFLNTQTHSPSPTLAVV